MSPETIETRVLNRSLIEPIRLAVQDRLMAAAVNESRLNSSWLTARKRWRDDFTLRGWGHQEPRTGVLFDFDEAANTYYYHSVYPLTGSRADKALLCRSGIRLNGRDAPMFDPETFDTNWLGLFVAGGAIPVKDTGMVITENGRFHGEKIVEVIAQRP